MSYFRKSIKDSRVLSPWGRLFSWTCCVAVRGQALMYIFRKLFSPRTLNCKLNRNEKTESASFETDYQDTMMLQNNHRIPPNTCFPMDAKNMKIERLEVIVYVQTTNLEMEIFEFRFVKIKSRFTRHSLITSNEREWDMWLTRKNFKYKDKNGI